MLTTFFFLGEYVNYLVLHLSTIICFTREIIIIVLLYAAPTILKEV
jgi:hypothetical protein